MFISVFDSTPLTPQDESSSSLSPSLEDASETDLLEGTTGLGELNDWQYNALSPDSTNLPSFFNETSQAKQEPHDLKEDDPSQHHGLSRYDHPQGGTLKGAMEAALFMTNKPMSIDELAEKLGVNYSQAEDALLDLVQDYAFRTESSLEIGDSEEGYILQVREEYAYLTQQMIPMNLSVATVRTLSVIAIRGPLLQSTLIELRGSTAYDHVQELLKHGLVHKKRQGRSSLLSVTTRFHEQFKLQGKPDDLEMLVELELRKPLSDI